MPQPGGLAGDLWITPAVHHVAIDRDRATRSRGRACGDTANRDAVDRTHREHTVFVAFAHEHVCGRLGVQALAAGIDDTIVGHVAKPTDEYDRGFVAKVRVLGKRRPGCET